MPDNSILLIDDNDHLHEIFRCFAGIEDTIKIKHATSLNEGLEKLTMSEPDAVFLDNRLAPFNDFRETVPLIRNAGFNGKIVVVSADTNHSVFKQAQTFTVHSYADKFEFTAANFNEKVSQLLN